MSSIIRCIAMEEQILTFETKEDLSLVDYREITDPIAQLRMNIGLAWEQHYISNILTPALDVIDHPGEMHFDGVYMTHDGESVSVIITDRREEMAIVAHECKATYKSINTVGDLYGATEKYPRAEAQWMWLAQMQAYCKGLGTRFAELHALFICGDYSRPIKPLLKRWRIEFTQEEIDANWSLLKDYAEDRLGREI